jgi:hypothetical protein
VTPVVTFSPVSQLPAQSALAKPASAESVVPETVTDTAPLSHQRAPSESHVARLAKTEADALQVFQEHRTPEALLGWVKRQGIAVYDGNQIPWVDALCKQLGAEAFVYTPFTKRYQTPTPEGPAQVQPGLTHAEHLYEETIHNLAQKRQQGLFLRKDCPPDVLMHEVFHVIQEKNGLPFGVSPEADARMQSIADQYSGNSLGTAAKRIMMTAYAWWQSARTPSNDTVPQHPVARAMHYHTEREAEVDRFLLNHGQSLGLPPQSLIKHKLHLAVETQFRKQLTQVLDKLSNQPTP